MRTVTIHQGACSMVVEWFDRPCPVCRTLVLAGKSHHCKLLSTLDAVGTTGGKATVEALKGAK